MLNFNSHAQAPSVTAKVYAGYEIDFSKSNISDCPLMDDQKNIKTIRDSQGGETYAFKNIARVHLDEWRRSAIDDEITKLNLISIPDVVCKNNQSLVDNEFRKPIVEFLGWDRTEIEYRPQIGKIAWVVRGLEPTEFTEERLWGHLKIAPMQGRKHFKYEEPISSAHRLKTIYLKLPEKQQKLIREKNNFLKNSAKNFWHNVFKSNQPVHFAEGEKKAAALLSFGYIAISIPGICGGMHTFLGHEKIIKPSLDPDLIELLKFKRIVYIIFDYDREESVRKFVHNAEMIFADLLEAAGAQVKIVALPGPEKGVDDFIVARGEKAYAKLVTDAKDFKEWKKSLGFEPDYSIIGKYTACAN